jgi:aminoglycoside 6'-N-acetyltransferase
MSTHPSSVELVPFDVTHDLQRLSVWVHRPHVSRWWGEPDLALAAVRQHPPAAHALIAVDAAPVGYLCWQSLSPEELAVAGRTDLPAGIMDVDILIGEPDFLGRGFGPQALSLLCDRLRAEGRSEIGIAAAAANPRSLRAYEKAGFRQFREFRENGEDWCYLVRSLEAASR